MRRSAAVPILALVLAACANDPVSPGEGGQQPQLDEARLGIYESLARELVGAEELPWKEIVIVSRLCENAGTASEPLRCDDALTVAEQDELARRLEDLGPPVRFVEDPTPLYDEDWMSGGSELVVLRLGTISEIGDRVDVGGSYGCGGRCGSGTTYILEEEAGTWAVVGTTGPAWIA